ncbi:MAG: LuxR C-terminal-related transcriptional regulator [Nitrospirota bacterium]
MSSKRQGHHIIVRVREKIKTVESLVKDGPIIIKSYLGDFWVSERAKEKLRERNIDTNEFLEWLNIGVKHLCETSYSGIYACMIPLPGESPDRDVIIILCEEICKTRKKRLPVVTAMERKVLKHLARGLTNKEIASNLKISAGTVNAYLDSIYRKLGASNRLQAACIAVKSGLVVPSV